MSVLLLALVLGAPVGADRDLGRSDGEPVCSVSVLALDPEGRLLSTRTASGSRTPAVVFRGRSAQSVEGGPPLLFDVFNPRGQRYQVLLGATPGRPRALQSGSRPDRQVEARLAVAGSSIAWTSMFGRWRVEPRFEGQRSPCGLAQAFTILP
ncbi:MAG TPA: hypothetical protein VLL75_07560 [Vicinamibacteria bacterium]|nr:hypothetical protein [Vicinamibacteria bacterium]